MKKQPVIAVIGADVYKRQPSACLSWRSKRCRARSMNDFAVKSSFPVGSHKTVLENY